MKKNPWEHRSEKMKCKTCMWFVPKSPKVEEPTPQDPIDWGVRSTVVKFPDGHRAFRRHVTATGAEVFKTVKTLTFERIESCHRDDDQRIGRCRRYAPTMNGYPVVFTHDWCGDHKLDEGKV